MKTLWISLEIPQWSIITALATTSFIFGHCVSVCAWRWRQETRDNFTSLCGTLSKVPFTCAQNHNQCSFCSVLCNKLSQRDLDCHRQLMALKAKSTLLSATKGHSLSACTGQCVCERTCTDSHKHTHTGTSGFRHTHTHCSTTTCVMPLSLFLFALQSVSHTRTHTHT